MGARCLGGGVAARLRVVDRDRVQIGLQGVFGLVQPSLSIPMAVGLGPRTWLTAMPAIIPQDLYTGVSPVVALPLGAVVSLDPEWALSGLVGLNYSPTQHPKTMNQAPAFQPTAMLAVVWHSQERAP